MVKIVMGTGIGSLGTICVRTGWVGMGIKTVGMGWLGTISWGRGCNLFPVSIFNTAVYV